MKKLLYYLHGILFAFAAPISAYITDQIVTTHAAPHTVWRAVVFSEMFFVLSAILFLVLTRDHISASMISTFAVLGFFYTRDLFLPLVAIMICSWLALSLVRKRYEISTAYGIATLLSIVMTFYYGGKIILFSQSVPWDYERSMANPIEIRSVSLTGSYKPDIYYIILDAYGGTEMLQKLHGYDNSEFTSALAKRGFVVRPDSKSNYTRTLHSVGSSLNMQYLDRVEEIMGTSYPWWPLQGTFAQNETRRFLESQGYKTVGIASGWSFTSIRDSSFYAQPYPIMLNEFERFFIQNTNLSLFGFLNNFGVSIPSYDTHRESILYEFEKLKEIPIYESPKFVLVHIIAPHPPFVFDSDGRPINPSYGYTIADNRYLITPPSAYEKGYLNQLTYVNKLVLDMVDAILQKSSDPPIIVIQGDHGPGNFIDSESQTPPCFFERYSILNAYYLPDLSVDAIPPDITPVNSFRLIFDRYFSAGLELLPNRQYFSVPESVHQFVDVSDRINDACIFPAQ